MARILFFASHTLYARVALPLAFRLVRQGHRMDFVGSHPSPFGFSYRSIQRHPTRVTAINRAALAYVARLIGDEDDFKAFGRDLTPRWWADPRSYDLLISTTKDLDWLRAAHLRTGRPAVALGYQHFPCLVKVGGPLAGLLVRPSRDPTFFGGNSFARIHRFRELVGDDAVYDCGFTFLDRVHAAHSDAPEANGRHVLIFHPGGYRGIITDPDESARQSYAKQKAFITRLCLPLIRHGFVPVIKAHPLPARYHSQKDVQAIVSAVEAEHGLPPGSIISTDDTYWPWAFRAAFVLTFGSASLYELWSAGVRRAFVGNFEGKARSEKFRCFPSIFLDSYKSYLEVVEKQLYSTMEFDALTEQVFRSYFRLFDGCATERVITVVRSVLERE